MALRKLLLHIFTYQYMLWHFEIDILIQHQFVVMDKFDILHT